MRFRKAISCCLLNIWILSGCIQLPKYEYDPTRQVIAPAVLDNISTIGVIEPDICNCSSDMQWLKKEALKSVAGGAAAGAFEGVIVAIEGGIPIAAIITAPIGAVAGALGGAAIPMEVPTTPTEAQLELVKSFLELVLDRSKNQTKYLIDVFLLDGNELTSKKFVHVDPGNHIKANGTRLHREENLNVDAILYSEVKRVTFIGYTGDDPELSININFKFFLKSSDSPEQCLGWYEGIWEGKKQNLSEWNKDNGQLYKEEFVGAYKKIYQDAILYFFNRTDEHGMTNYIPKSVIQIRCGSCRNQHILNQAE